MSNRKMSSLHVQPLKVMQDTAICYNLDKRIHDLMTHPYKVKHRVSNIKVKSSLRKNKSGNRMSH